MIYGAKVQKLKDDLIFSNIFLPLYCNVLRNFKMIIANPIYDTVFKRLMENRRIARFFIETIIDEQVDEIALVPQEYVYKKHRQKEKRKKNRMQM